MRILPVVLMLMLAPEARAGCEAVLQAFRAEAPAPGADATPSGMLGCTRGELKMLQVNANAVARAKPVTDPAEAVGTWLGDDVARYAVGIDAFGQEVLRIGLADGGLAVRQDWLKAVAPAGGSAQDLFENGAYAGWVAQGVLRPGDEPGSWSDDLYNPGFRYSGRQLEWRRSDDLSVKLRLNYFEQPVRLERSGRVLLLHYRALDPFTREERFGVASFTRVQDDAPDMALLTVMMTEQSAARYVDCFAHQLDEGQGPLIEAMAPLSVDGARALLREVLARMAERDAIVAAMKGATEAEQAVLRTRMGDWAAGYSALIQRAENQGLLTLGGGADLGCPELR